MLRHQHCSKCFLSIDPFTSQDSPWGQNHQKSHFTDEKTLAESLQCHSLFAYEAWLPNCSAHLCCFSPAISLYLPRPQFFRSVFPRTQKHARGNNKISWGVPENQDTTFWISLIHSKKYTYLLSSRKTPSMELTSWWGRQSSNKHSNIWLQQGTNDTQ